jgi:hypothetical protein
MAMESFWRYQTLNDLAFAVPMMLFGILLPLYPSHILAMFGFLWAAGSFSYAGVITYAIRRKMVINDTD